MKIDFLAKSSTPPNKRIHLFTDQKKHQMFFSSSLHPPSQTLTSQNDFSFLLEPFCYPDLDHRPFLNPRSNLTTSSSSLPLPPSSPLELTSPSSSLNSSLLPSSSSITNLRPTRAARITTFGSSQPPTTNSRRSQSSPPNPILRLTQSSLLLLSSLPIPVAADGLLNAYDSIGGNSEGH